MSDEYQVRRDIDRLIAFLNSLEQQFGLSSDEIAILLAKDVYDTSQVYKKEEVDELIEEGGGGDLSNYYTKSEINAILSSYVTIDYLNTNYALKTHTHSEYVTQSDFSDLSDTVDNKVDKITGKGLSEADFTSAEKTKLANIENGANKTIVDSSLSSTSSNPVQNQVINTALNGKADINHNHTISNVTDLQSALDNKVDKVTGKGLSTNDYTSSEKDKLANIEAEANKTVVDSALSGTSRNPVENNVIRSALNGKSDSNHTHTVDSALDKYSTNPVQNQAIANAFENMRIKVVDDLPNPSSNYDNDVYISMNNWDGGVYVCRYVLKENGEMLGYGEWEWVRLDQSVTFDTIYPVGSIYMSVNSTSPSVLFGGTWEQLTETFLYASTTADTNSTTATGGEATHTLTINEMPSHNHAQQKHNHSMGENWSSGSGSTSAIVNSSNRSRTERFTDFQAPTIGNTGGGQAHNNMPPYMKVYMWKRTA